MANVYTKLLNAFEILKKEGKKISPFAVERRAGVGNGSCKNHPKILEMVLFEKQQYRQAALSKNKVYKTPNKPKISSKYENLEKANKCLKAENERLKSELSIMATSIAQLSWELHRHKSVIKNPPS